MPSKTIPYEIKRSMPDDQPIAAAPALFYTRAGDVLPGTLRSLDRSGAEFAPAITETGTLAAAQLEAIQFGGSGRMNLHGFTEAGWHVLSGSESKIVRKDNALEMEPGTSIGHPGAMQSSEIRFDVGTESFFAVRLRMFCAGTDPARSTNLLVMPGINGGITCGIEAGNDQIDEPRVQVGVPSGDAVAVRLVIQENEVELYLNGTRMQTYPIPSAGRAGAGLIVEPASVWGNSPHPIKLADFSTVSAPGSVWMPDVAADAKSEALTVPRFRRDDPPVHALIATNGDILRGEIEAATKANFGFRNGLDELVVSRDRVKAVIWLGKPQEAPSPAAKNPARALLDQKLDGRIGSYVANLPNFPSFLQRT